MKNRELEYKVIKTPLWYEEYRHVLWRPKPETVWERIFPRWKLLLDVDCSGDWDTLFEVHHFSRVKERVKTEQDMRDYISDLKIKRKAKKVSYDDLWEIYGK